MLAFLKQRWVYHSIIWITGYAFLVGLDRSREESALTHLTDPLVPYLIIMLFTYAHFYVKERFFDSRAYWIYILSVIIIGVISVILLQNVPRIFNDNFNNDLQQDIGNVIFLMLFGVGLQYFKRGIINQQQLQELRAKSAETELKVLKAQINPHFFFNTLNNIYAVNQIDSEKGSEMIMELSDVMRYHLEFSKQSTVLVEDEIQLINSYINIEELRLTQNCDLRIEIGDYNSGLRISPLLFLPFVENAFKHGTHPTKACFVHVTFTAEGNNIKLTIKNSVFPRKQVVKTQIGLENTKRRLQLIYPDKHELLIEDKASVYSVNLSIEL